MKLIVTTALTFLTFAGCATRPPEELVRAREYYQRANSGPAGHSAPVQLHAASEALAAAEASFKEDSDSYKTRDLAYVAQRRAEIAEATARSAAEQNTTAKAKDEHQEAQGAMIAKGKDDLSRSQTALVESERSGQAAAAVADQKLTAAGDKLAVEQAARAAAEKQAADAQAALAKLAAVKEEARGLVITISGSMLFASGQSALLPAARTRLEQVANVLLTTKERKIVIEGHTDSQGADDTNMALSQRRAEAVRAELISRGYGPDLIVATGLGETRPVADNGNPEGRANNRRVELIIDRGAMATAN